MDPREVRVPGGRDASPGWHVATSPPRSPNLRIGAEDAAWADGARNKIVHPATERAIAWAAVLTLLSMRAGQERARAQRLRVP